VQSSTVSVRLPNNELKVVVFGPCIAALTRFNPQQPLIIEQFNRLEVDIRTFIVVFQVYWASCHDRPLALIHELNAKQSCVLFIVHHDDVIDDLSFLDLVFRPLFSVQTGLICIRPRFIAK
jgi:hypothetical protein